MPSMMQRTSWIRLLLKPCDASWMLNLKQLQLRGKIEEVHDRLKSLAEQKDVIGLREGVTGRPSERLPTTSLVEESGIFGRDDDKEEIIKGLLSEDKSGNEVGVIAIVGMGGMGKTTLAQRVYNDERVKKHFDLEAWLQVKLREKLKGKCFLLILDDVWNKNLDEWEALSKPWKSGARGSKVIVTTRDEGVASVTNASTNHRLEKLTEEDCCVAERYGRLVNLRHLDITETGIKEMPMHLGNLKCLQTLPKFIVSKHRGSGSGLGELGKLANLRGALSIWELQNVESPQDALDANLKNKKYLQELALFWNDSDDADISESQRSVLDNLRPHPNLKSLTVNGYSGERFPDWPFGSLKVLKFKQMLNWETWFPFGAENEDVAFPSLEELYIRKCPKLKVGFSIDLPSLAKLEIDECPQLVISLRRAPAIRELELMSCNEVLLKELPVGMQRLRVGGFDSVESLPEGLLDSNSCLQELEISDCSSLVSLPTGGLSSTLKNLKLEVYEV
ncbi:putative disease resistance RPP13-like protein 1 [Morella rubra]|uniref:Putative disease resistance RPP13-like protein 1 n=1 Tax=Morella rubra TaxID=262757 RepID=A0A6A1WQP9_9ROSI|nr:putative disease resistance RPP13-like protein 1 [Morella rubra]